MEEQTQSVKNILLPYTALQEKEELQKKNILTAWAASGLFPFNPGRVLRNTPKPLELIVPNTSELIVPCLRDEIPQTPFTPVSAEGLTSLYNSIQHDNTLNKACKHRLQKLANAAYMFCAERAFLKDERQALIKMNNEAKVRRSTKSTVVGKAKVMSYEDIEEARAKCATKEAIADQKKVKRGRKRKNTTVLEKDAEPEMTQMTVVPEPKVGQVNWRAPVARMI